MRNDIIDAIKYHLAVHGLKANNPINNPKISRLKRFFSLINEIILFILLLLEKMFLSLHAEALKEWHSGI